MLISTDSPPKTPLADATSRLIRRRGGNWHPIRDGGFIAFRTQDFSEGPLDQIPATDAVDFEVTPVNDVVVFSHRDDTGKLVRMSGSVLRLRVFDEDPESGERVERDYFVDSMNLFFDTLPPDTLVDDPHPLVTWPDEPAATASTSSLSEKTVAAMISSATKAAPAPAVKTTRPTTRKTTADVSPDQLRRIVATAREARTAYDLREGRRRQPGFEGIAESSSEAYRRLRDRRVAEKREREARRDQAKREEAARRTTTAATKTKAAGSTTSAAAAAAAVAGALGPEGTGGTGGTGGSGKVTVRELVARARAGKT